MTASTAKAGRLRRIGLAVAVGGIALAAAAVTAANSPAVRGYGLYHGWLPLEARIVGHTEDLPPASARCAGCHDAPRPADPGYRSIPALDGPTLTTPTERRNGPASAYDGGRFCKLLRDGNDAALIMVDRTMPRFRLSDADCEALWSYVSRR